MVSAYKFQCHSPAPFQKPVQVHGSTSKEYVEDTGGAVSRNIECDEQEKRRELATCSHARHCWDYSFECVLISNMEVCATVSRRKWGIAFDGMVRTSSRSTHASAQDPCLPVSDNCVPRRVDKFCGGTQLSLATEPSGIIWRTKCSEVLPELCMNWRRGSRKVVHRPQEEYSPVLYRTLCYVFKRFTSSISSTTLPNAKFKSLFVVLTVHINKFPITNALLSWKW